MSSDHGPCELVEVVVCTRALVYDGMLDKLNLEDFVAIPTIRVKKLIRWLSVPDIDHFNR